MKFLSFKGGIHPDDGKTHAYDKEIKAIRPGNVIVVPLSQHIGAPVDPCVEVGEYVRRGQMIGDTESLVSAPVHSSVSGTVKSLEEYYNAAGAKVKCIVIENDGKYEEVSFEKTEDVSLLSREEVLHKIGVAGVVGMGGAGFPTKVKLMPMDPEKIEYVIINCAECEPYITADYRRMIEYTDELISGVKIMLQLFPNAKVVFGVEANKLDCVTLINGKIKGEERISVATLKAKYPQGGERQIIYAITGRAINSSMLPSDAGCIVQNVETVVAIHNAVIEGRPVIERVVSITGDAALRKGNYMVPIGMMVDELLEYCEGFHEDIDKIISGGPMMGFALFTTKIPVTKTTSCLLGLLEDEVANAKETACINCGRCVGVCPCRLIPSRLSQLGNKREYEAFEKLNGLECVECGCCSYACPAKRHLKQSIGGSKRTILAQKRTMKSEVKK